jgi:hypothetical protein
VWVESDLTNAELYGAEAVEYMSDKYFELTRKDDATEKILALGSKVVLRTAGKVYRVLEKAEAAEAPAEPGE